MDQPIYVFNHVPKTAGSTALNCFRQWFKITRDYPNGPEDDATKRFLETPPDIAAIAPGSLLSGHYHYPSGRLSDRIPGIYRENAPFRLIAFLRDPFRRKVSHWRYGRRVDFFPESLDFASYLRSEPNFMAHALECDESNFKDRLNSYFFLGFQETFQEDLDQLAGILQKPNLDASALSKRVGPESDVEGLRLNITDQDRNRFVSENALDYAIVEYAKHLRVSNATSPRA